MRRLLWSLPLLACLANVGFVQEKEAQHKAELEQAGQTLKNAGVGVDGPALLQFFQQRTLSPGDEAELQHLVDQLGDKSFLVRARATSKLAKAGPLAMPFLQTALKKDDQEIVRRAEMCLRNIFEHTDSDLVAAAALLLAEQPPANAARALLDYLPFATDDDVVRRIRDHLATLAVRAGVVDAAVVAALEDRYAVRRGAAAAALVCWPEHRDKALPLLKDPDAHVRLWVSQALIRAKDARGLPVLVALIDQLPEQEIWQVEEVLLRLAGETAPTLAANDVASHANVRKMWQQWLVGHDRELDKLMKEYSESAAFLDHVLLTVMPMVGGVNGEVLELGPNNKVLWKVQGLRYPVDAQITGPKRVLVAEYLNRRVVEMDFQGNPKWSYEIDQPIGCQQLANGNVFIAARRQIVEVNRDKKVLFTYGPAALYFTAARKMPNGDVLVVDNVGSLTHLDHQGKVKNKFNVGRVYTVGGHIDILPGNRVLVPEYTNHRVVEYTLNGEMKSKIDVKWPTSAVRLPNGFTLVASMIDQTVRKFDGGGKERWSYKAAGRPWCARAR